ncbi:hypothetical protein COY93_01865 [Candidatus Uhrbacteria bacterium CG_4_10_14_0_8_um_filter_58_22]|uniref:DUF3048 domain-containing protein n=1 Tax=Candidatus Uhrbacteria bacterium CG_4_10_14_0_8_um_filter_58_22 TaxID=1975029 RepID=A0A2M7QAA5_9BACT|nr:MAG: hypothetical protein AUJ19_02100 [Parcubacteria group bacterium CG1_02_58_44]PIY62897.1 MAG: hypothetical protein COY93_01865 [Candidatus Uhrbacteria bacterium CG_4_10_14_0_8_um_filter_58_22]
MLDSESKTVRRQADARRAVFAVGAGFWCGPAGWVLVLAMLAVGVAAISFTYWSGDDACGLVQPDLTATGLSAVGGSSEADGLLPSDLPRSAVDGLSLADRDEGRLFTVVLDNIAVARPAASIAAATLVWEAPVEGGITRLLALFRDSADLRRIGPVRSVRPYFVDWTEEYGAVLTHVGGSPQALSLLHGSGLFELDEMRQGGYFWRDRSRSAPHNVYTSSDLLHEALVDYGEMEDIADLDIDRPFRTSNPDLVDFGDVVEIGVDFGSPDFDVTWVFDDGSGTYLRHQGAGRFLDENQSVVAANNVIVQVTDISVIDSVGRRSIRTSGTGSALLFQDGRVREASWSKEGDGRTRFLDGESGDELPLNVGTTWIEVVGEVEAVSYQ